MYRAIVFCNSVFPLDPDNLAALKGPLVDGLMIWTTLTDPETGLFDRENVHVYHEREADEILDLSEEFFLSGQPGDHLLWYYSGHGWRRDQALYLCGRDTVTRKIGGTGLSMNHLLDEVVGHSDSASVTIILDCCYSGAAAKGAPVHASEFEGEGRYILAASRRSEPIPDSDRIGQPSPYTAQLCAVLQGSAVSEQGPPFVGIAEIARGVNKALRAIKAPFRPHCSFNGTGDLIIARRRANAKEYVQPILVADLRSGPVETPAVRVDGDSLGSVEGARRDSPEAGVSLRSLWDRWQRYSEFGYNAVVPLATILASIVSLLLAVLSYRYWPARFVSISDGADLKEYSSGRGLTWILGSASIAVILSELLILGLRLIPPTRIWPFVRWSAKGLSWMLGAAVSGACFVMIIVTIADYTKGTSEAYWAFGLGLLAVAWATRLARGLGAPDAPVFVAGVGFAAVAFLPFGLDEGGLRLGWNGFPGLATACLGWSILATWRRSDARTFYWLSVIVAVAVEFETFLDLGDTQFAGPVVGLSAASLLAAGLALRQLGDERRMAGQADQTSEA